MDQKRIGAFISERRRAQNLTQRQLADILSISDKTVSKWECGNGMPEVGLMLPLCKTLGIHVNELLSGECLNELRYCEKAEDNILDLLKDRTSAKTKVIVTAISVALTVVSALTLILIAAFITMPVWTRFLLIGIVAAIVIADVALVVLIHVNTEIFECAACGEKFVPTLSEYIMGLQAMNHRRLKCPHCGKKCWNRSRLRE